MTIEELALKLDGDLWVGGESKRIYLERGHSTKKMSTSTYIYQVKSGSYQAKCRIKCPSQSQQWIENEQSRIEDQVMDEIYEILNINQDV